MTETAYSFSLLKAVMGCSGRKREPDSVFLLGFRCEARETRNTDFFFTGRGHQCREVVPEQASKSRNTFLKALEI